MGLDRRVWALGRFGFRESGSGFCWVFTLSYITNWGSGLVPAYVEMSGSGPVRVLDSRGQVFARFLKNPLHHYKLTL